MIVIFTGLPGSGKSYKLGKTCIDILYRNKKEFEKRENYYWTTKLLVEKYPVRRELWTNLKMSPAVEQEFRGYIKYYTELKSLTPLRDCDVVIDEVGTYFDARLWETLSLEMRRWLAQHRKLGIEIYGAAQDFAQVDISFRRLTTELYYVRKLAGSNRPSKTIPSSSRIWGICTIKEMDPVGYDENTKAFNNKGMISWPFLIRQEYCEVFDTGKRVQMSDPPPFKHIMRRCADPDCKFELYGFKSGHKHKILHV